MITLMETDVAQGQARRLADVLVEKRLISEEQKLELMQALAQGGSFRFGDYEIVSEIGRGGMGAVYKAHEVGTKRVCAIKMLPSHMSGDEGLVTRFRREGQACVKLQHGNIVRAYRVGEVDGTHYFAMEFVDGTSVQKLVEQGGPMPIPQAVDIVKQIAQALSYAHAAGLIHRDIKPANVLVTKDGVAKLADLGLVKELADDGIALTQSGTGMGTPAYMPPEQFRSAKRADPRSDIYSLGAMFYHMVTGKVPYEGATQFEVMQLHEDGNLKAPRQRRADVPVWLDLIICKMLQRKPENRFQTAGDLVAALDKGSAVMAPASGGERVVRRTPKPVTESWDVQLKQKGGVRTLHVDTPTLENMVLEGKVPLTAPVRKGREGGFRPVSEYPDIMVKVQGSRTRETRSDGKLKTMYKSYETSVARKHRAARIRRALLLIAKILLGLAVIILIAIYAGDIIRLVNGLIK
jgi:serine/threonine protein kinase